MLDTSGDDFFGRQAQEARGPESERQPKGKLRHSKLVRRVALVSAICLVVLAGVVGGGGYLAANHLAGSVHRITGITALAAAHQPVMPAGARRSRTVLLTGDSTLPAHRGGSGEDHSSTFPEDMSGLIALVHLNADNKGGAVVNLPPNAVVRVPGHGRMELWKTLPLGGPSLLIRTVENLTNVRIDGYSVVDFDGVRSVVQALGGVDVYAPFTMHSDGITFPKGLNHLTGADVLPYLRQADVSEIGREELQSGLIRSILYEIAQRRLFSRPGTGLRVLHALASALSVDSNMSNSELMSLALKLGHLRGRDGTFVTAPSTGSPLLGGVGAVRLTRLSRELWQAIRHDSVAEFARRHPSTVTPGAPA
jgi:LCP family protein required for cell wall assembly